jgi:glycosyltransferase involved in cell wall biosynthesis
LKRATRKRRVYWITEEFPPEVGGTGLVAATLAQGLAARDLETLVITRQIRPPTVWREAVGAISVRRVRPAGSVKGAGWRALPVLLGYFLRLSWLLVAHTREYDLVFVSSMKTIPLVAVPVCRVFRKACVIRIESPFELVEPVAAESLGAMNRFVGRNLMRVLSRLQRATLARADCVIAISREIEQLLTQLPRPPRRIAAIPNPVDLAQFKPVPAQERARLRDRLGLPQSRTIALYAGRLSRAKGTAMLVEEWPRLLATHADLHLVLVGSGKESWDNCEDQIIETIRAHGLETRVTLPGQSSRVHEYMQAADFFVSPSEYEGFGLAVVEALACGLPVVVTSVGIAPEIIRHGVNGFLFPPKDRQALVPAMEECVAQRSRWEEIGRRARESAVRFDRQTVFDQYATLCAELRP